MSYDDGYYGDHTVPDGVQSFIQRLEQSVVSMGQPKTDEDRAVYEEEFFELCEKYYKSTAWPSVESVAPLVEDQDMFLVFYKELYYRHKFQTQEKNRERISLADREESFGAYLHLFNQLAELDQDIPEYDLPSVWIWDIIESFISQFESFHQYRNCVTSLSDEEIAMLTKREALWSSQTVIQYLRMLVEISGMDITQPPQENKETHPFFQTVAEFALIALLRVNVMLADYMGGLQCLTPINLLSKYNAFRHVYGAFIALYYNMGFCYLMLRRYTDALKTFSSCYLRLYHTYGKDVDSDLQINAMYNLLTITYAISKQQIDDQSLYNDLKKQPLVQDPDEERFAECFRSACTNPHTQLTHFISTSTPDFYAQNDDASEAPFQLQLAMFLKEVRQRKGHAPIYNYLKMCTTVSTDKLASVIGYDGDESKVHSALLSLRHKTNNMRWHPGSTPAGGSWTSVSEVDFTVNKDMIHLGEQTRSVNYSDQFMFHIRNFDDMTERIHLGRQMGNRRY